MAITIVQRNRSKGILTWYARVPDKVKKGSVHFFSLGTDSKAEAKLVLQERIRDGSFDARTEPQAITLGEAVQRYEKFQRAKGIRGDSLNVFLNALRAFEALYDRPIAEIRNSEISEAFLAENERKNPTTYNNNKTLVSSFFYYVVNVLEALPGNPVHKAIPKRKRVKPVRHFWTADQVDRIIAMAPNPETRLAWAFMAFAGLRKSEAIAMRPEKIHDGYIHLVGKGDKPAKIPLCPRLKREIDRFNAAGGIWERLHCTEYSLIRIAAQALPGGFPGKAHAHRFRHSFGSNLIRAGVNIKVVQTLMRHENIQMTLDIYGHIMDSDAEDAIVKTFP